MNRPLDFNSVRGIRPWDSPYGSPYEDVRRDRRGKNLDQRDIDDCLSCPKPKCTNCKQYLGNRFGYKILPKEAP